MDPGDMAQDTLEREEEAWMRSRKWEKRESSLFCEDCGTIIPEPRRKALQGVRTCVGCQSSRERDRMMENF